MATLELGNYLHGSSQKYHACLEACVECLVACEACSDHCLDANDVKSMVTCLRLCLDSAELCGSCVVLLSRGSERARALCGVCADVCDRCADECEKYDDETMRRCAEACRRCAEECRRMAA